MNLFLQSVVYTLIKRRKQLVLRRSKKLKYINKKKIEGKILCSSIIFMFTHCVFASTSKKFRRNQVQLIKNLVTQRNYQFMYVCVYIEMCKVNVHLFIRVIRMFCTQYIQHVHMYLTVDLWKITSNTLKFYFV